MNNQDIAQSNTDIASTPSSSASGEETLKPLDISSVSAGGAPDALVELVETPRTPTGATGDSSAGAPTSPLIPGNAANDAQPPMLFPWLRKLSPFWQDRLIEAGLILSMGLYYLVGNPHFGAGNFLHLPPYLYSFPFLAIFACLSWYRLSFSVALMPLTLPYYFHQKTVFSHGTRNYDFSLVEITLVVCLLVALGQWLVYGKRWRYRLTLADLRARVGYFLLPILVFFVAALISIGVAVDRQTALRDFHEEILAPLLYLLLAFCCLRTRSDVKRLIWAFLGSALIIAFDGLIQYFFFPSQLYAKAGGDRVHAMYGSANSIGLFFDYALPFGLSLLIFQFGRALRAEGKWWPVLLLGAGFVPLIAVLIFSQSLGSALALPIALLFILALSVRNRRTLLISAGVLIVLVFGGGFLLRHQLIHFITNWHDNSKGISTITKRYYLWQSAWHLIQQHALLGVGMDNWLCYYSPNNVCMASYNILPHFWIPYVPGTTQPTGLLDEATLSHPHDIFLHVWVSMGIFGLLAFVAVLALFAWLFARVLKTVRRTSLAEVASLEWIVLGVGGAMLAALCQGLIDSAFLEQDLAFCFWMLIATLLVLRVLTGTPWRGKFLK